MSGVQGSGVLRALPSLIDEGGGGGPGGCDCLIDTVADDFNRSEASGWGTSSAGYVWLNSGPSMPNGRALVTGTVGRFETLTTSGPFFLAQIKNGVWKNNHGWTMTSKIKLPARPVGGAYHIQFDQEWIERSVDIWLSDPGFEFDVFLLDNDELTPGSHVVMSWTPGAWYFLKWEYQWSGIVSRAKIWKEGDAEPDWMVSLSWLGDSNSENDIDNYFSLSWGGFGSSQPTSVDFDYLSFETNECERVHFDDFQRIVGAELGWGTSATGITWAVGGPGGVTDISVSEGQGKLVQGSGFTGGQKHMHTTDGIEMWGGDFVGTARFKIMFASASSNADQMLEMVDGVNQFGVAITKNNAGVNGADRLSLFWSGSLTVFTAKSWSLGANYELKWERVGNTIRAKTWLFEVEEPAGWDVTMDGSSSISPTEFRVFTQRESSNSLTWGIWWDFIDFEWDGMPCYPGGPLPDPEGGGETGARGVPGKLLGSGNNAL